MASTYVNVSRLKRCVQEYVAPNVVRFRTRFWGDLDKVVERIIDETCLINPDNETLTPNNVEEIFQELHQYKNDGDPPNLFVIKKRPFLKLIRSKLKAETFSIGNAEKRKCISILAGIVAHIMNTKMASDLDTLLSVRKSRPLSNIITEFIV